MGWWGCKCKCSAGWRRGRPGAKGEILQIGRGGGGGGGGDSGEGGGFELNLRHGAKRGDRGGTVCKGGGGRDTCTRYQIKRKHFAHEERTVNGGGGVVSLGGAIRSILNGTEGYIFEGRRDIFCEEEYYKQFLDTLHTLHNLA